MEDVSVLSQQSVSGKIVSLILCVWKSDFFQIQSHIQFSYSHMHLLPVTTKKANFTKRNDIYTKTASVKKGAALYMQKNRVKKLIIYR